MLRSCLSTLFQSTSRRLYPCVCPVILFCTEDRYIRHYNQCPNAVDNRYCYFLLKELMAKTGLCERERAGEYTELLLYVALESGHYHEPVPFKGHNNSHDTLLYDPLSNGGYAPPILRNPLTFQC
jgi:hypothetical protein